MAQDGGPEVGVVGQRGEDGVLSEALVCDFGDEQRERDGDGGPEMREFFVEEKCERGAEAEVERGEPAVGVHVG